MVHLCIQLPPSPFPHSSPPQHSILFCKHLCDFYLSLPLFFSLLHSRKDTVGLAYFITGPISMLVLCEPGHSIHNTGCESPRTQILPHLGRGGGICPWQSLVPSFWNPWPQLSSFPKCQRKEMKLSKVTCFFPSGLSHAPSPQRAVHFPELGFPIWMM